jgi:hypothetical protein
MTLRSYRTDADPSPFIGLLKKMSFHADQMNKVSGGVQRLRKSTPDGEVTLMRVGEVEYVDIIPSVSGGWEMIFKFPDTGIALPDMGFYVNIDLKKKVAGVDVQYWATSVKIQIPINTATFPLYTLSGAKTTMYLQIDDIVVPVLEADRIISCSLSVWENHGTLGEVQEKKPTRVTGMKYICYYGYSKEFTKTEFYPLTGYVVTKEHENWHNFLIDGWLDTSGKYSINVTMVKESGDYPITLEYLNNNSGEISYSASGDTDWSMEPLVSIKDDYEYSNSLRNYINRYNSTDTLSSSGTTQLTLSGIESDSGNFGGELSWPIYYYRELSQQHWSYYHFGLWEPSGILTVDKMDSSLFSIYAYYEAYEWPILYGKRVWIGHGPPKDVDMFWGNWHSRHVITTSNGGTFDVFASETIISADDFYYSVMLVIPPSEWQTIWNIDLYGTRFSGSRVYTSIATQTIISTVTWVSSKQIIYQPIQLPSKNANKQNSTIGLRKYITYSAGTSGSGGED